MISIFNHNFTTPNRATGTNFLLMNEGQIIRHSFQVSFNFNFNSTPFNQFVITGLNEITMLNGSFEDYGVVAGDSVDIDAIITGGTNINITATVLNVSGNVISFTTNIFASGQINEMFPLVDNQEMFFVNNSRSIPESIDLFYNLIQIGQPNTTAPAFVPSISTSE